MIVTIELPLEIEAKLREQAAKKGTGLEDYLCELAQLWAYESGAASHDEPVKEKTREQRLADWNAFIRSHDHITAVADDSRESIYEGCGE